VELLLPVGWGCPLDMEPGHEPLQHAEGRWRCTGLCWYGD
jgi:hypothetical protein